MLLYGFMLRDFLPFWGLKVHARLRRWVDFGSARPHRGQPSEQGPEAAEVSPLSPARLRGCGWLGWHCPTPGKSLR